MTWNCSAWEWASSPSIYLFILLYTARVMSIYFISWIITQYDYVCLFAEIIPVSPKEALYFWSFVLRHTLSLCRYILSTHAYTLVSVFIFNDSLLSGTVRCSMLIFLCSVFWEFNKNYIFLLGNAIRNQYLHKGTLFATGCRCFNFQSADRVRTCIWVNNLRNIHMYVNISICNYLSPLNQTWTHSAISNSNH